MKSIIWPTSDVIVDRDDESDDIIKKIETNKNTKIHIIYSKTAIGKSAIITKVLEKYNGIKYDIIRVKSIPNNNASDMAWEYLEVIFKAMSDYFDKISDINYCGLTFDDYLSENNDEDINEIRLSNTANEWFSADGKTALFKKIFHSFFKIATKSDEFSVRKYKHDDTFTGRRIRSNYIKYILSQRPILLIVDNLQNIDGYSFKCLTEWLSECSYKNHYFLFEFTIDSTGDMSPLYTMAESLSVYAEVETTQVPDTSPKYIVDIISRRMNQIPTELNFNINVLKHYKDVSEGNIKEIIDYSFTYSEEYKVSKIKEEDNGTLVNIRRASFPYGQYLLALLVLHEGRIGIQLIKSLTTKQMDLQKELDDLKNKNLIKIFQQTVEFEHASIKDQWDNNVSEFQEVDSLAYNDLKKYYELRLKSNETDTKNDAWKMLLRLYAQREPFLIKSLLPYLEENIIKTIAPESVWEYIKEIYDVLILSPEKYEEIFFRLLEICYKLELYDEGYNIVEFLDKLTDYAQNKILLVHRILYLAAIDRHFEAVKSFEKAKSVIDLHSRTGLNLLLSVLCSYRYIDKLDECIQIHKFILANPDYKYYPEYAFFLRLANIYLPNRKSIRYAKASIKLFREQGNTYQVGKSLITYAKLLAGLGKYDKAAKELKKAEDLLVGYGIRNNVMWVDKASIMLMQGVHNDYIWELLCKSDYTAVIPYDKLAIIIVKLAWCYENREYHNLSILVKTGEKLVKQEPDFHIHALFYYNAYALYKLYGDSELANIYYQKVIALKDKSRYVKARFEGAKTKEEKERLKYPWFICYLSFWNHDIEYYVE